MKNSNSPTDGFGIRYTPHYYNFDYFFSEPKWGGIELFPEQMPVGQNAALPFALLLCIKGSVTIVLCGKRYNLQEGSVVFLSKEETPCLAKNDSSNLFVLRVDFSVQHVAGEDTQPMESLMDRFLQHTTSLVGVNHHLPFISRTIWKHFNDDCPCGVEINLLCLLNEGAETVFTSGVAVPFDQQVMHYLEANIAQPLTVDDLASAFSVSRRSLYDLFERYFNATPKDFINKTRMVAAALLLEKGTPPAEVSEYFHFNEHSSFSRTFRKYMGKSPSDYQAMHSQAR